MPTPKVSPRATTKRRVTGRSIAERRLSVVDDPQRMVIVRIDAPTPDPNGDWQCSFAVEGLDDPPPMPMYAYGIDALQALMLAFDGVRAVLDASGLAFSWAGGEPGDAGIPRVIPTSFGRGFVQRVEEFIEWQASIYGAAVLASAKKSP